jgi:hypothetical protein
VFWVARHVVNPLGAVFACNNFSLRGSPPRAKDRYHIRQLAAPTRSRAPDQPMGNK